MIAYMHLTDKTATNLSLRSEYSPKVSTMEKVARSVEFKVSSGGIFDRIDNYGVKTDFNLITKNTIFRGHKSFFGACSNYLLELFLVFNGKHKYYHLLYCKQLFLRLEITVMPSHVYHGRRASSGFGKFIRFCVRGENYCETQSIGRTASCSKSTQN